MGPAAALGLADHVQGAGTQCSVRMGRGGTMEREEGASARWACGAGWLGTGAGEAGASGRGQAVSFFLSAPRAHLRPAPSPFPWCPCPLNGPALILPQDTLPTPSPCQMPPP